MNVGAMLSKLGDARPWIVGLTCAAIATACTIRPKGDDDGGGGTGGASTGGSGGSGGEGECASKVICSDCRTCAAQGSCANLLAACSGNSACVGIDECMTFFCSGSEAECLSQCESQNQAGVAAYRAARQCVDCDVCAAPCGTALICGE